ncbi:MAG: DUF3078 domain-containing protein [Paramuribaculum sp.]|nr:DUF3078 domain-containing protein [Paramuribaculum sp.]
MRHLIITIAAATLVLNAQALPKVNLSPYMPSTITVEDTLNWALGNVTTSDSDVIRTNDTNIEELTLEDVESTPYTPRPTRQVPSAYFAPVVFDTYQYLDSLSFMTDVTHDVPEAFYWLEDLGRSRDLIEHARQRYAINSPGNVKYLLKNLPEPPKSYRAFVDPATTHIVLEEIKVDEKQLSSEITANIDEKHWLHNFNSSLQFSQAYISPNWYQGGNSSFNLIALVAYNVKLNTKFYPKYLFEFNVQYKFSLNSTPEDKVHDINISEDILQINATAGLKAAHRWFYSANFMFKTQLFNSYPTNSDKLQSSFLSPGELNLGLGMTYSYENEKKTVNFGVSLSPLSWNMKTCITDRLDETAYGIEPGRKVVNNVGSSAELTLAWKITYNISYTSRLFIFSDYKFIQADWEHTFDFNINKFLSTRLYLHMRYDSQTPIVLGSNWKKFQLKEILSFGFAYKFGTV